MTRLEGHGSVTLVPVTGIGEVPAGADLAALIAASVDLADGDVVVVSSKIVAKAEGRVVAADGDPDGRRRALTLAEEVLVETPQVVVVRTGLGHVCANAGIDASNVPGGELLLLPVDPDASARALRADLAPLGDVAVVISDTFGRAWREGQTDVALGVAGIAALRDERGVLDRNGRPLTVTLVALADQIAGAADLVRDKASGIPVVVVRGLGALVGDLYGGGAELVRDPGTDLFPHGRGWLARRLATGEGVAVRPGPPTEWEWELVVRAAGAPVVVESDGGGARCTEGLAAGRVEACLLDLGYPVVLAVDADGWTVRVRH